MFNFAKTTPSWMNRKFFEKVIRENDDSQAEVVEFEVSAGSKPGNNFASAIYRALITFKSTFTNTLTKLSVIIKTQTYVDRDSSMFKTEMEMYCKVLPAIGALLQSIGDKDVISPR